MPGASKVYEEPEFLEEMAMKYFLHEMMDCFDLVSVLVIIGVTRGAGTGFAANMDSEVFCRVVEQIVVEIALEILFMSLTKLVIQRKLSDFKPSAVMPIQHGVPFVAHHKVQILALVATTFPAIFLLATVFKQDLAAVILQQID